MRTGPMKALGAAALLMIGACGSDDETAEAVPEIGAGTESAPAAIEVAAEAPLAPPVLGFEPAHGGTVVAAGEHPVEIVTQADGSVEAFVLGPDAPPPSDVQLTVRMPGDDGEVHPVVLIWDPGQARFRGQLRRVQPTPGPVEVVYVVGAETYRGRAPRYVVIGTPSDVVVVNRAAGPDVVVVQDEPPPPATVVVQRPASPRVNVHVERPAPPSAHIVVEHPSPPRPRVVVRQQNAPRANVVVHAPGPPRPAVRMKHRSPRVRVRGNGGRGRVRVRAH